MTELYNKMYTKMQYRSNNVGLTCIVVNIQVDEHNFQLHFTLRRNERKRTTR